MVRAAAAAVMEVLTELGVAALVIVIARDLGGPAYIAVAVVVLGGWFGLSRWRWPYKPCRRCKGTGRNKGSNSRRHGDCKRCGGGRRVQRPGARTVHRAIRTIRNRSKEKDHV